MKLKKQICIIAGFIVAAMSLICIVDIISYREYSRRYNDKLEQICEVVVLKTDLSPNEVMKILSSDEKTSSHFFEKYGIDIEKENAIIKNDNRHFLFRMVTLLIVLVCGIGVIICFVFVNRRDDKQILEIIDYVDHINKGCYDFKIDNSAEGKMAILKNEVYVTMIMLKEAAENTRREKVKLKDSLSDISHQLKTPITSLLINLENLSVKLEVSDTIERKILRNAIRDVNNISFMVQMILKMSEIDAGTVELVQKEVKISEIVNKSVAKLEALSDLKGINIELEGSEEEYICCDIFWQTEAVTNILKNALEHAKSRVMVCWEKNSLYASISIKNDGPDIPAEDIGHIFDRFYKSRNSAKDSIGIGLALAKAVVEMENGYISVISENGFTEFIIKYYESH